MCLIAKDEEASIRDCFASWWDGVDEVILVDTGSKDRTVEVAREFAEERGEPDKLRVERFLWVNDFAAARNHADSFATKPWRAWCDLDDTLEGAECLRALAATAEPDVAGFVFEYAYGFDQHGNCICTLKRERLVRSGASHWEGRVHEAQIVNGRLVDVGPEYARWVHRKQEHEPKKGAEQRNLRILRAWNKDEPDNPRVLAYLGTELAAQGKHKRAITHYRRYLKLPSGGPEERAQVCRKLAVSLLATDQADRAYELGIEALRFLPAWPDSYLTLAQARYQQGRHDEAIWWAERVLEFGQPDSLLILNPLDYTLQPRIVLAAAHGALGRIEEAISHAEAALAINPDHSELRSHLAGWKGTSQREAVAATFCGSAELLIRHDEQLKALTLLEQTVPVFAQDHPRVVALRSQLRERLAWLRDPAAYAEHYDKDGPKPEDFVTDPIAVGERLPRAHFLREGVEERLAA